MSTDAAQQCKQHVNELRRTHFHLGFDSVTNYTSAQKQHIEMQKALKVRPMSSFEPNQKLPELGTHEQIKARFQKNNYQLGDENPDHKFESIQQTSYKRPQTGIQPTILNEKTKNDLRTQHFQLGFHDFNAPTEYKNHYDNGKEIQIQQKQDTNLLRKHNHDFGDNNTYYSTMYNQTHNKQYDSSYIGQNQTKQLVEQQKIELRKVNIQMGDTNPNYITSHKSDYQNNIIKNNFMDKRDLQQKQSATYVQMGSDDVQYLTEVKNQYMGKQPIQRTLLDEKVKKDLRATHFYVGFEERQYETTSNAYLNNKNIDKQSQVMPQKDTFKIGAQGQNYDSSDHFKSSYKTSFSDNIKQKSYSKPINMNMRNNVVLGSDISNDRFISESVNNYKQSKGKPSRLDANLLTDLKSHHIQMGLDGSSYETTSKVVHNQFDSKSLITNNKIKMNIQENNFTLGQEKVQYDKPQPPNHKTVQPIKLKAEVQQYLQQYANQVK